MVQNFDLNIEIKILTEQIFSIKQNPRIFCVLISNNIEKNMFKYENYFSITKNHKTLTLIPSEKYF